MRRIKTFYELGKIFTQKFPYKAILELIFNKKSR